MGIDDNPQEADSAGEVKKYWAFISYSSKDKKWGAWLHRRLEGYPIPKEFQGTELFDGAVLGKNLRPVFRDRDELSGSSDLGPAILNALKETRYLIVLCSKNSAKSEWVNKEIEDFKELGGEKHILALILDGEPNATSNADVDDGEECFPPALRYPAEPLAGDLRKEGDGKERGFLKVIAGISQLDFDKLYRRHERAQKKKRLAVGIVAASVMLLLTGISVYAIRQRDAAMAQEREALRQKDIAKSQEEEALRQKKLAVKEGERANVQARIAAEEAERSEKAKKAAELSEAKTKKTLSLSYYQQATRLLEKNKGEELQAMDFLLRSIEEDPESTPSRRLISFLMHSRDWYLPEALITTEANILDAWMNEDSSRIMLLTGDFVIHSVNVSDGKVTSSLFAGENAHTSIIASAASDDLEYFATLFVVQEIGLDDEPSSEPEQTYLFKVFNALGEVVNSTSLGPVGEDEPAYLFDRRFHNQPAGECIFWKDGRFHLGHSQGLEILSTDPAKPLISVRLDLPEWHLSYGFRILDDSILALTNEHICEYDSNGTFLSKTKIPKGAQVYGHFLPSPERSGMMSLDKGTFAISGLIDVSGATPMGVAWKLAGELNSEYVADGVDDIPWFDGNVFLLPEGKWLQCKDDGYDMLADRSRPGYVRHAASQPRATNWPAHILNVAGDGAVVAGSFMDSLLPKPQRIERMQIADGNDHDESEMYYKDVCQTVSGTIEQVSASGDQILVIDGENCSLLRLRSGEGGKGAVDRDAVDRQHFFEAGRVWDVNYGLEQNITRKSEYSSIKLPAELQGIYNEYSVSPASVVDVLHDEESGIAVVSFGAELPQNSDTHGIGFSVVLANLNTSKSVLIRDITSYALSGDNSELLTAHGTEVRITPTSKPELVRVFPVAQTDSHMIMPAERAYFAASDGLFLVESLSTFQDYHFSLRLFDSNSGYEYKHHDGSNSANSPEGVEIFVGFTEVIHALKAVYPEGKGRLSAFIGWQKEMEEIRSAPVFSSEPDVESVRLLVSQAPGKFESAMALDGRRLRSPGIEVFLPKMPAADRD